MKKLDISPIAPGISMYVKGGTLQFLQLAYQEAITELQTSRIGSYYDTSKAYVLNGCVNSGSGSNYVISAGSIFYNGEIFLVPAATFTISGSNIAVGAIATSQYITDADPTDFSDGIQRNVHNIRQIVFAAALAGSGVSDYVNLIFLAYKPVGAIGQTVIWNLPSGGAIGTYFNTSTGAGIHALTLGWNIDSAMGGNVAAAYKYGDANFGALDQQQGVLDYQILATDLPKLLFNQQMLGEASGPANGLIQVNSKQLNGSAYANDGSPNNPISLLQPTITKLFITRVS